MIKKCVQKPYTVLVAVIIALLIGAVSLTKLQTDLLPDMTVPYMVVVTTYTGASPEKVERDVTQPLESALGTVSGVENVTSVSAENYSMITLEFDDDMNMDSAMVKLNTQLETAKSSLPDSCGTPNVMEISMDMMATVYASVSKDDADIYDISDFVTENITPEIERIDGVASVSSLGLIEKSVEVRLNQDKIDTINDKILKKTNDKLDDAKEDITSGKSKLKKSESTIKSQKKKLAKQQEKTADSLADASVALDKAQATKAAYESQLTTLQTQKAALETEKKAYEDNHIEETYDSIDEALGKLHDAVGDMAFQAGVVVPSGIAAAAADKDGFNAFKDWMKENGMGDQVSSLEYDSIKQVYDAVTTRLPQIDTELANMATEIAATEALVSAASEQMQGLDDQYQQVLKGSMQASAGFGSADAQMSAAQSSINSAKEELDKAQDQFEDSAKKARDNANIDSLVTMDTLSNLIYAQNFEMPAGYIDDKDDHQWLLKVGDNFSSVEELDDLVLCKIDDIGDIKLSDVADITVVDNARDSYEKVNGEQAVVLAIYKNSTASTSKVSSSFAKRAAQLEQENEGLHIETLMDQGDYITMFIKAVLQSMVLGALLALVVLIIFLKDVKPTVVVAFSIPFSVLVALILMYASGISINMMSLSGLSLGIGMLVDNSIVVIENIYRLRARGLAAPRAALQGTKQVAGAIISSTLTTICVFLPMIFTSGYVRQLMLPFALTIGFALLASLVVAMFVVPVIGSVLLKKYKEKTHPFFDKVCAVYTKILGFCLKVKIVPLALAIALLAFSVFGVMRMGISVMPDMTTQQIAVSCKMPDDTTKEDAYATADKVMEAIQKIDNVESVGALTNVGSLISSTMSSDDYLQYSFYVLPKEGVTDIRDIKQICKSIEENTKDLDCDVSTDSSSMSEMSSLSSSGLTINITGRETDKMLEISEDVMKLLKETDGCTDISNGQEDGDDEIYLEIDKTKAMRDGLTVAQIYQTLSDRMNTDKTALTGYLDDTQMDVKLIDETDVLNVDNLLDTEFTVTTTNDDGEQETKQTKLKKYATISRGKGVASINRKNGTRTMSVTCSMEDGYNATLVGRDVQDKLNSYKAPKGYNVELGGSTTDVNNMLSQMMQMMLLGFALIYLIMVAQFQSLLSPFIIIFTVPLAFTGGFLGLLFAGEQLSMISLLGFLVLMGTVVNNGIVFVDYANQLRIGGMKKRNALIVTGRTRMRPILMTALTTILAMVPMAISHSAGDSMGKGMAIVIIGGMAYATLMTLFIIPVMYDILYRRQPKVVDVGDDTIDDVPDDAAEFLAQLEDERKSSETEADV